MLSRRRYSSRSGSRLRQANTFNPQCARVAEECRSRGGGLLTCPSRAHSPAFSHVVHIHVKRAPRRKQCHEPLNVEQRRAAQGFRAARIGLCDVTDPPRPDTRCKPCQCVLGGTLGGGMGCPRVCWHWCLCGARGCWLGAVRECVRSAGGCRSRTGPLTQLCRARTRVPYASVA